MEKIFFEGFALQASLIFALGAQNLFVLESGMKRSHPITVSFVCFLCDLALILLGVAGAASVFTLMPSLKFLIGLVGVSFLFFYGIGKMTDTPIVQKENGFGELSLKKSALLAVTFSILNPHAYLDAFVLIGGYSSKYSHLDQRIILGLGAAVYSGLWFLVLSSCSAVMKPFLCDQKRMKLVSFCTGSVLVYLSGKLAMDLLQWVPSGIDLRGISFAALPPKGMLTFASILY